MWIKKPIDNDLREVFDKITLDIIGYDESIQSITKNYNKELKNYDSIKNMTSETQHAKDSFILKHQRDVVEKKKVVLKSIIELATAKLDHLEKVYKFK